MPELMREGAQFVQFASPAFLVVSLIAPVGFRFRKQRWALLGFFLLVAESVTQIAGWSLPADVAGLAIVAGSIAFVERGWRESVRFRAAWIARFQARKPVTLAPPFEGRWRALGTGPSIDRNHHLTARDQWFAVDWVRQDAPSRGSCVFAPADGLIAYVEDGHPDKPARRRVHVDKEHPAGNYVSLRIKGEDCCVIVAHLEQGSIAVRAGQQVRTGTLLGLCGNSGNTSIPHVHIHVQPGERFAAGSDWGIPVVFGSKEEWLRPGATVIGGFSTEMTSFPQA